MLRSFCSRFSLETGAAIILWLSLGFGIWTMLSPGGNVTFRVMNPPAEFWKTMETMRDNWLTKVNASYAMSEQYLSNMTHILSSVLETVGQNTPIPLEVPVPPRMPTPPPIPSPQKLFPQYPEPGSVAMEFNFGITWLYVPKGFIQIIVSGIGLFGVYEDKKAKYLFPFLVWSVLEPTIEIISSLFSSFGAVTLGILLLLFQFGLYVYTVLVVYSYYSTEKLKTRYSKSTALT